MNKWQISGQRVNDVMKTITKPEIVVMETLNEQSILYYQFILQKLNNLSVKQWNFSKYMYAKGLNFLCFKHYLPAHINETYENFQQNARESRTSVSFQFKERPDWPYPKWRHEVVEEKLYFEKSCSILYFHSDKKWAIENS